jgi:cytochrome c556
LPPFRSVPVAIAQQDPVTARENLMKENNKRAIAVVRMMRGPAPFDAAEVDAAFTQWAETAQKLPGLLPDNSKTGGDNRASPKIWVDKKDFDAKAAAFAKVVSDNHDKAKSSLEGLQLRFTGGPSPDGQGSIPNIHPIQAQRLERGRDRGNARVRYYGRRRPDRRQHGRRGAQYLANDCGGSHGDRDLYHVAAGGRRKPPPERKE